MIKRLLEDEGEKPSYIIDEYSINGNYRPLDDINNIEDKAVCLIKYNNIDGTGFFCEIPDPDEPQEKIIVLFTCYHVLKGIKKIKRIKYKLKNENEKELDLTKRKKWYHRGLDYICIKIEKEDNISIFFKVDEEINDMNYKQYLKNLGINSLGYISSDMTDFVRTMAKEEFPMRCTCFIKEIEDEFDGHKFFVGYVYVKQR